MPAAKKPEEIIKSLEEHNRMLIQENERLLSESKKIKALAVKTVSKLKSAFYDLEMETSRRFEKRG